MIFGFPVIFYADDTTLLNTLSNKCRNDLSHSTNNELDKVYMLLCTNKLSLNIKKTKFMIFHNQGKHLGIIPNIIIKNTLIESIILIF